jgi:sugar/nucleoside kinase (ribokinase family)
MGRVAVVGYFSIDRITDAAGQRRQAPGGAALYAALGVTVAGAGACVLASAGLDWPDAWLGRLAAIGVDVTAVVRRDAPSRRTTIRTLPDGRRALSDMSDPDWARATAEHAPEWPGRFRGATLVTACPMPADSLARLIADAQHAGASVIASTSAAYASAQREALLALVPNLAVFAPTEEQTRLLMPARTDSEAAHALARLGPAVVQSSTDGSTLVVEAGGGWSQRLNGPPVARRERTGSSQARTGALAAALSHGLDLAEAATVAMVAGTQADSGVGPRGLGFDPGRGRA